MKRMDAISGIKPFQSRFGLRALQRDQGMWQHGDLAGSGEVGVQVRLVSGFASRVDDHQQTVAEIGDHQVVQDAAGRVGEHAITLAIGLEAENVDGQQAFERPGRIRKVSRARNAA